MDHGEAVQVDPIKPKLNPPGTERLKLNCGVLLSASAFKLNLRRYTMVSTDAHRVLAMLDFPAVAAFPNASDMSFIVHGGRGLHSSTSHLNLSRF